MAEKKVTIDSILALDKPTQGFLCSLSDNKYKIDFLSFRIRDAESGFVLFEIEKDPEEPELTPEQEKLLDEDPDARTIRYHFGPSFFKLKTVGTSLKFSVGDKPAKNFRMIERHYFRETLIQSFDFTFPFCIPNSVNDWENIYDIPNLSTEVKKLMIENPYETMSDSFYFVEGELIMHNKAEYDYSPIEEEDKETIEEIIKGKK